MSASVSVVKIFYSYISGGNEVQILYCARAVEPFRFLVLIRNESGCLSLPSSRVWFEAHLRVLKISRGFYAKKRDFVNFYAHKYSSVDAPAVIKKIFYAGKIESLNF